MHSRESIELDNQNLQSNKNASIKRFKRSTLVSKPCSTINKKNNKKMPEFEENTQNPDLNKEAHQYQPSKKKSDHRSSEENVTSTKQPSNMRGRWKRSSRGPVKPKQSKIEEEEPAPLAEVYEPENIHIEEPTTEEEPVIIKKEQKEHSPKHHHAPTPKAAKPIDRKDVFIPKTKEESQRHKGSYSTAARKKPSLWQKILAFLGLAPKPRKHKEESKGHYTKHSSQKRKYYPKKHSGHQNRPYKNTRKQDQKSDY